MLTEIQVERQLSKLRREVKELQEQVKELMALRPEYCEHSELKKVFGSAHQDLFKCESCGSTSRRIYKRTNGLSRIKERYCVRTRKG